MTTLYYAPGTCSAAIHTVLYETGLPFTAVKVDIQTKSPALLKVNPRGAVPVLEDDGEIIREGAAILIYLAEKTKSPLLPTEAKARAQALEWLCFANSTLHPAYGRGFWLKRITLDDAVKQNLHAQVAENVQRLWNDVESQLTKSGPYICGAQPSLADFLLTVIANWTGLFGDKVTFGPHTQQLFKSIIARPSYQKVQAAEGTQFKAVA